MSGTVISDNLSEWFLKTLKLPELNDSKIFKNHEGGLSQILPNETCGYWLITPNQHFVMKLLSFDREQLQISERAIIK